MTGRLGLYSEGRVRCPLPFAARSPFRQVQKDCHSFAEDEGPFKHRARRVPLSTFYRSRKTSLKPAAANLCATSSKIL